MRVLTADWFRRQTYPTPACPCVYPTDPRHWLRRVAHPRCPQHGQPPHWKAAA